MKSRLASMLLVCLWAAVESSPVAVAAGGSPFAGSYSGPLPYGGQIWSVKITGGGSVGGSYDFTVDEVATVERYRGRMTGDVSADGRVTLFVEESWTYRVRKGWTLQNPWPEWTINREYRFQATLDADGNIVGVRDDGVTFVWDRT